MNVKNCRLTENVLNLNNSVVKKRNEVAEYYFSHGITKTIEKFKLTKQGVYSDVRSYKSFLTSYNLVSNIENKEDFLNLRVKDIKPLFNNSRICRFFDNDNYKLKYIDFSDMSRARRKIRGLKSFLQFKEFVENYADILLED